MKRLLSLLILSMCLTSVARAGTESAPLCSTPALPNCVIANWGLVQPDGVEGLTSTPMGPTASTEPRSAKRMSVALLPAAMFSKSSAAGRRLNAVVSPDMLFRKETAALVAALQRARFDEDGTIVRGKEQVAAAAARLLEKADDKYKLTIYVKVPQRIKPDDGTLIAKKVRAVNDVLGSALEQSSKPGTQG